MWCDEIVEEVRRSRQEHAEAHGFNLNKIYEDLKNKEKVGDRIVVTFEPKEPRRNAQAQS